MSNPTSCHYNKCPHTQQLSQLQAPSQAATPAATQTRTATTTTTTTTARFRCSQCKQALYCSKACQKGDWKKHRKVCQAWSELDRHVQSLPLEEVHRRFQQAQHTIKELETHQSAILNSVESETHNGIKNDASIGPAAPIQQPTNVKERSNDPICQKPLVGITLHPAWNATIEDMVHLTSYQITLKPMTMSLITHNLPDVSITFQPHLRSNQSTLCSVGEIMSWILPVQVQEYTYSKLSDCISIRLKCTTAAVAADDFMTSVPPVTSRIHQLQCKSCRAPLLSHSIERIVPLPSGYWDEISDYLICYPGQPAVHFGSTTNTVPVDMIWEDPSVWVVHPDLLADTVQPLAAVALYATQQRLPTSSTQPLRNSSGNSWRPQQQKSLQQQRQQQDEVDVFVVEQLCCSYCCYPLGLATLEGYYLYRHRLVLGLEPNQGHEQPQESSQPSSQDPDQGATIASRVAIFIAQELKRYAESQAIFTSIVTATTTAAHNAKTMTNMNPPGPNSETTTTTTSSPQLRFCLLLHVVSWDSILLHASASTEIFPKRVVKVIYKVSSMVPSTGVDNDDDGDDEQDQDISTWRWGGLDLCCDPIVTTATATATSPLNETPIAATTRQKKLKSVHLTLDPDEWEELVMAVTQCPYFFPKDVVDATIGVKLGMDEIGSNAAMAAMDLY
jgi:hypothetical protein